MSGYIFTVSCPQGKEFHERLKKSFPNLSKKIMVDLTADLIEAESKTRVIDAREAWITKTALPIARTCVGRKDPFAVLVLELIEMLKLEEITVSEKEADWLLNRLQNEWCDRNR